MAPPPPNATYAPALDASRRRASMPASVAMSRATSLRESSSSISTLPPLGSVPASPMADRPAEPLSAPPSLAASHETLPIMKNEVEVPAMQVELQRNFRAASPSLDDTGLSLSESDLASFF